MCRFLEPVSPLIRSAGAKAFSFYLWIWDRSPAAYTNGGQGKTAIVIWVCSNFLKTSSLRNRFVCHDRPDNLIIEK